MITERFNFYDIYGYLIPGVTLVGLLWAPFALVSPAWRDLEWSSAALALVGAYAAGFLVNRLTAPFVRISIYDQSSDKYKRPAYLVFEPRPPKGLELSETVKAGVIEGIRTTFGIDVRSDKESRGDVLLLARRVLQTAAPSYAEQFEGLYAFCLTFAAVLVLGAYYFVGWALSRFVPDWLALVAATALAVVFCFLHLSERTYSVLLLPLVLALIGAAAATRSQFPQELASLLLAMAIASCLLAVPFYGFHRYFSNIFTTTIFRDFYVLTQASPRVRRP